MTEGSDLTGRVAIVTGAGRGIGRAVALELARAGASVVVNDIGRTPEGSPSAEQVVQEIEAAGGRAAASVESVTDYDAAGRIVALARDRFGGVDILVNNAGIAWSGQLWTLEPDEFERVTASHIKGTYNCSRHAVEPMREQGFGRIVNLVSRAGITGLPGVLAYGVGKGGVLGFTNAAARDLISEGITVNAVNPSSTATPMVLDAVEALEKGGDEAFRERAANLRRMAQQPERVAILIAYLSTPRAGSINGRIFLVEQNRIGLFQPLTVMQSVDRETPWTLDDLGDALETLDLDASFDPYA